MLESERGVKVAGVHDPEGAVVLPGRRRDEEILRVVPVRDRDDANPRDLAGQCGDYLRGRLRGVQDDG